MEKKIKNIAIVCANGLGDGLISLALTHNLQKNGYEVTTFSNYLPQLSAWFPHKLLVPFPEISKVQETFSSYDRIISTDGAFLARIPQQLGDRYQIFYERDFARHMTVLENFLEIGKREFGLQNVTKENGLVVLTGLMFRKYSKRVIIHPMSTSLKKNWLPGKFIKLAKKLQQASYEPIFVVSPTERIEWEELLKKEFALPLFPNVDELARYIYESGYMIGNDSGVGHLAANLGIPTLSLFSRQSVANLWRPAWSENVVITPTIQLPGARLRTQHWQKFLTVNKVWQAFKKISKNFGSSE